VKTAVDGGINFFDTANVYASGRSEEILGQSIRNLGLTREELVIATKVHGQMGEGPNARGASRGHIMDQAKASLKRLQLDHIDLYQIHGFDPRPRSRRRWRRSTRSCGTAMSAISACRTGPRGR
jgi:aryl-alcohol dehydrogenase-like predicted oxidoreductase